MFKFRNLAVTVVTLISAANTFGAFYLGQKNINNSDIKDEITEDTSLILESVAESGATPNETLPASEMITSTTEVLVSEEVDTTVEQVTTQNPDSTEKYEISSIAKLNNGNIHSCQSYAVNPDTGTIYFIDRNLEGYYADVTYYIYKYDIQASSIELVKELPYSSVLYPICLTYNKYDKNIYCFAGGGASLNTYSYFQVESNEFHSLNTNGNSNFLSDYNHFDNTEYHSFYFVSPTEFVVELENGIYRSRLYLYNTSDDSFYSGYIEASSVCGNEETNIPFMHDENYYWLGIRNNEISVIKTQKLFHPNQSGENAYYGDVLQSFSTNDGWIAGNVYNDAVYLMKNDFSIYKVDLDVLEQMYIEQSQTEEKNNLINPPAKDNNLQNALTLVIDGKQIKQTGINNLTEIKYFNFVTEDSVIVYDDFDQNYKLISAIK